VAAPPQPGDDDGTLNMDALHTGCTERVKTSVSFEKVIATVFVDIQGIGDVTLQCAMLTAVSNQVILQHLRKQFYIGSLACILLHTADITAQLDTWHWEHSALTIQFYLALSCFHMLGNLEEHPDTDDYHLMTL
jgi:hypothetical protein